MSSRNIIITAGDLRMNIEREITGKRDISLSPHTNVDNTTKICIAWTRPLQCFVVMHITRMSFSDKKEFVTKKPHAYFIFYHHHFIEGKVKVVELFIIIIIIIYIICNLSIITYFFSKTLFSSLLFFFLPDEEHDRP